MIYYFQGTHTIFRPKAVEYDNPRFDVDSFCGFIQKAIPKAVKAGKFRPTGDQTGYSNHQVPIAIAPPRGFVPKLGGPRFRGPKVKIPKLSVPKLRRLNGYFAPPTVGSPMSITSFRDSADEESSAEKMEKFKKGVQKMLHVVKVLGQIDQYLSERTRIIVEKLSKTFGDP